nr:DNA repair protein [Paracoccus saliphilus]
MFPRDLKGWLGLAQFLAQRMAVLIVLISATLAACASLAAVLGILPWIGLTARISGEPVHLGMPIQLTLTIFLLGLTAFLPSSARVMALEVSHRQFKTSMEDVARAYHAAHAADRSGVFRLKSEYDATRERLDFLHRHPDLINLKPELLELAAKMSFNARDLAQVYADDRVQEARTFIQNRQGECVRLEAEIERALATVAELRGLHEQVDADEERVARRIERLQADILEIMHILGIDPEFHGRRPRLAAE